MEHEEQIARLRDELAEQSGKFHGLVHSIAFADYEGGMKPFHKTPKKAFLQAVDISCFSLMAVCECAEGPAQPGRLGGDDLDLDHADGQRELRLHGADQGGVGCVAGLPGQVVQPVLADSLQRGGPGAVEDLGLGRHSRLVDAYLYAEQVIPRKQAVRTEEVADVAAFLLSPRSSGINAQRIMVNAGMSINYFDGELIRRAMRPE